MTGAGTAFLLHPFSSWAFQGIDPKVLAIVKASIGTDTHNHIDVPLVKSELPGPDIDLVGALTKSGLSARSK